jgi:polyhydroxyalkanoate synthesis regulator phasin
VADRRPEEQIKGLSDALRDAIERTFQATAGSASETRERAGDLLNEVARRGADAREQAGRRGADAREAIGDVVAALRSEVDALSRRLAELESKARPKG